MIRFFCVFAVVFCCQLPASVEGQQANLTATRTGPEVGAGVDNIAIAAIPRNPFPWPEPDVNVAREQVLAVSAVGDGITEGTALANASALGSAFSSPAIGISTFVPLVDSTYSFDLLSSGDSAMAAIGALDAGEIQQVGSGATGVYDIDGVSLDGLLNVSFYLAENGGSVIIGDPSDADVLLGDNFEGMELAASVNVGAATFFVRATLQSNESWLLETDLPGMDPSADLVGGINQLITFSVPIASGEQFTLNASSFILGSARVSSGADGAVAQVAWDLTASAWAVVTPLNAAPLPADFNGDGIADEADFFIWQDGFPTDFGGVFPEGDADQNGVIDENDLDIWLQEAVTSGIPGDYNADDVVDLADYTVWRDTLGSTTDLRADGAARNGSQGVVDNEDYLVWKANFGFQVPAALLSSGTTTIPEPSAIAMLALLCGSWVHLRRTFSRP